MNEQLERIEKMLETILRNDGHIWWVGGFVYGETSTGDLFVILYPASDKLKEKVCRVYPQDFKKLPAFIPTEGVDGGDTEINPNKDQAKKKGIYHECPLFEITTYDGKETQMGPEQRFGDVLRVSRKAAEAVQGQPRAQQQQSRPQQQQTATQPQQSPAGPPLPPDDAPPFDDAPARATQSTLVNEGLPDFREMAVNAKTITEFDYAAYMVLKNGMYTDQERIGRTRETIVPAWKPGPQSNAAMLAALEVYRDKRSQAESRGEAATAAHQFAKREAMTAYNEAIKG